MENSELLKDWRIKDKTYIIVNLINRRIISSNPSGKIINIQYVLNKVKKISKKEKITILEVLTNIIYYLHKDVNNINIDYTSYNAL